MQLSFSSTQTFLKALAFLQKQQLCLLGKPMENIRDHGVVMSWFDEHKAEAKMRNKR